MPQKMEFLDKIKFIGHFSRKATRPRPSDTVGGEDSSRESFGNCAHNVC